MNGFQMCFCLWLVVAA